MKVQRGLEVKNNTDNDIRNIFQIFIRYFFTAPIMTFGWIFLEYNTTEHINTTTILEIKNQRSGLNHP